MDRADAVRLHDDLLASKPEAARHDADICPFCVEKASAIPPGPAGRDVSENDKSQITSTEGGTKTMTDISQETHEALLQKAVTDAVKATEAALATKTEEAAAAATKVAALETEVSELKSDNDRLNKDLDEAQVKLTSATEEVASLKEGIAKAEEAARISELASKRTEQVKNLKLFPETYIGERASRWAELTDEAWHDQLEEWKQIKPAADDSSTADAASAMDGTTEQLGVESTDTASENDNKPAARRAVLGL